MEAHPAPGAALEVVALDVGSTLVDGLDEQAGARVVAVGRALVLVAALEPAAATAVLAILIVERCQ